MFFYFNTENLPINTTLIITLWATGIVLSCFLQVEIPQYCKNFFHTSFLLLLLMFFAYTLSVYLGDQIRGYKSMCNKINQIDPLRKLEVISYKTFIPSISFYRNKKTIVAFYDGRETQFEKNNIYKKYLINDNKTFINLLENLNQLFIVTDPQYITEIEMSYSLDCKLIALQRDHSAYLCEK